MFYLQENLWQSFDGSVRSFSAMTNEHLANVALHIRHYGNGTNGRILAHVQKEIDKRNLSKDFIEGAPYPYQNPRDGKWYIWSFDVDRIVPINGKTDVMQKNG